jgi:putative ABC transport system permease protein
MKGGFMDAFVLDLRQAVRSLAGRPGFALVAVLTVALGVGANAAIFTLVNAALLRSLPFPDPEQLMVVWARNADGGQLTVSWPEYEDWRAQSRSFEALGAWRGQSVNLTGTGEPDRLVGSFVSGSFFDVLRARPHLGRFFRADESAPGTAPPVAVLSHHAWQRRFGGDPGVVGRVLVLNGVSHTVIGVAGPELGPGRVALDAYFMATEIWLPAAFFPNKGGFDRGQDQFIVLGRLAPGVSREAAEADVALVARRLEETFPDTQKGRGVRLLSLHEQVVGDLRPPLLALMGAAGLVLLIACANVANLLLTRAVQRQREMAVRAALGAGRWRLARQLLTESLVIAGAGGLAGLGIAWVLVPGLVALTPAGVLPAEIGVDGRVLAFTILVALATAAVFGVLPGLQASRPDLETVLRETGRGTAGGRARRRVRDGLVVAEVALSLVLLVGSGLLLRTVHAMGTANPGFRPERILTAEFRLPAARYERPEQIAAFLRSALEKLQAVPGVESAALIRAVPFSGNSAASPYVVEGRDYAAGTEPVTQTNIASPGYFETLGIPVLAGRSFDARDRADTPPAAVVNATFARQAWGEGDPLGRRFRLKAEDRWLTVVGVVGDIRHGAFTERPTAQAYTTHEQDAKIFACVIARTSGDPLAVAGAVRKAIWAVDPDQPVWRVRSLESLLEGARGPVRSIGILLTTFAALAVFLACVGLYGVLSGIVAQRTREIGIRMALGAPAARVVRLVVGRGMALTAVAIVLGLAGAAALSRLLGTLLFGVRPLDPVTFGAAAALLAVVALGACCLPARRAARLDPVSALAEE